MFGNPVTNDAESLFDAVHGQILDVVLDHMAGRDQRDVTTGDVLRQVLAGVAERLSRC